MSLEPFSILLLLAVVKMAEEDTFTDVMSVLERDAFPIVVESEVFVVVGSVGITCLSSDKSNGSKRYVLKRKELCYQSNRYLCSNL